jgi:hypothetical protein
MHYTYMCMYVQCPEFAFEDHAQGQHGLEKFAICSDFGFVASQIWLLEEIPWEGEWRAGMVGHSLAPTGPTFRCHPGDSKLWSLTGHSAWNFRSIAFTYILYIHTYCTDLYEIYIYVCIYMYTYVYIPYLRIETHGSWVSNFWTCTSIWWLNSRQLVADFRGCTWGNSAELPGPLVDD